jgi:hypothetical protein
MHLFKHFLVGATALAMAATVVAAPKEVNGVRFDDSATVGGTKLQLNGAGTRYKAIFKVYAAGMYLSKKVSTPEEAYAAPGPKRISITMLREIDSHELGKSFTKAFEENTPKAQMSKLIPGLINQGEIFSAQKKMVAGDGFTVDWIPGTGTVISVKGVPQGEPTKEPEFFIAMMRIWLGAQPADWKLKDALLGKDS